jgi:hypothetical protein
VFVVERNFAEFSSKGARDDFGKRHESSLQIGCHGEVVLERASAVCGANPRAKNEGVTAVKRDSWLDED